MIRQATTADITPMLALCKLMHTESIYASFNYDADKLTKHIQSLIDMPGGIALVVEEEGAIIGFFLGLVYEHWFGSDLVSNDFALFVHPAHRRSTHAGRLLKAYKKEAIAKGAKQVMIANSTGYEADRVAKLFEAFGFVKRGYVFELAQ